MGRGRRLEDEDARWRAMFCLRRDARFDQMRGDESKVGGVDIGFAVVDGP